MPRYTYDPPFRAQVLRMFNGECEQCSLQGERYPYNYSIKVLRGLFGFGIAIDRLEPDLPYSMDNVRLLCKRCHGHVGLQRRRDRLSSMVGLEDLDRIGEDFPGEFPL